MSNSETTNSIIFKVEEKPTLEFVDLTYFSDGYYQVDLQVKSLGSLLVARFNNTELCLLVDLLRDVNRSETHRSRLFYELPRENDVDHSKVRVEPTLNNKFLITITAQSGNSLNASTFDLSHEDIELLLENTYAYYDYCESN
ncbi:hypothetical protein [Aureibacillus halotolerans]|uniref:Uncharacterized protein n=1 Tax=Aureibacillus halotolerans TaxID=1508390 RepID=A0A4R6U4N6_9BACI|nr:hypothetical protein [Aureibacillus halotolerans]TDQ41428.1 hypothetical protein EV213_1035 [Aureibacillus halotolerans]